MSKASHVSEWLYVAKFWQKGWLQEWSLWAEPSSCPKSDLSQFQLQWDLSLGRAEPWATLVVLCECGSKEGQISYERGVTKCGPGKARGGAGYPPATYDHHMEQISKHSHGGADGAEVDEAWRRHSPLIPLQEQPQDRVAAHGEKRTCGEKGWRRCTCGDLCGTAPKGWVPWYRAVL